MLQCAPSRTTWARKWSAAGLLVAIIVVCSATAGLTYAVVEDAKEVRAAPAPTAEGQVLATVGAGAHKGEPLAVTQARIALPLAALAYMPEVWANIHSVNLSVGDRSILRGVDGVDVSGRGENATTTLYASVGDVITVRGLRDGAVALRDGTSHAFCWLCGTCGAFSVRSDRVVRQLADFWRDVERSYVAARRAEPLGPGDGSAEECDGDKNKMCYNDANEFADCEDGNGKCAEGDHHEGGGVPCLC